MSLFDSILLGVIQGVTEFLPVSSSGHLLAMRHLLGLREIPILFDVLLHVSTLAVVIVAFRGRIVELLLALLRLRVTASGLAGGEDRGNRRVVLLILVATGVTAAVGFPLSRLEEVFAAHPRLLSAAFAFTALLLVLAHRFRGERSWKEMGPGRGALVGLAQGIGVLPGVSRSGITIAASLACGLERGRAGELSFLIAIPAVLGALILKIPEADQMLGQVRPLVLGAGMLTSFAVGMISLRVLLWLVRRSRLHIFSFYLVPLAVVTFFLF